MAKLTLDDLLKLDFDQMTEIKSDLIKTRGALNRLKQMDEPVYVVPPFGYLMPLTTRTRCSNGVLMEVYLKKIEHSLHRSLENHKFSPEDAYFLKGVGCPYLARVPSEALKKAVGKD